MMTAPHATTPGTSSFKSSAICAGYHAHGNLGLLAAGPRTLLLLSAQGKTPRGGDSWLLALQAAIGQLARDGGVLLGSAAPLPWDLAVVMAAEAGVPVILLAPERPLSPEVDFWRWVANYGLDARRLLLLGPQQRESGRSGWQRRDALAWALAERVIPICVRPGGRLAVGLEQLPETRVDRRWQVPFEVHPWTPSLVVPPVVDGEQHPTDWLVHWTRRCYAPWPGETAASLCRSIIASTDRWCRDAPATLQQILSTGILYGSRFRSAGGAPVVSFSGATPGEMRQNFRWCSRKVAPMWEPWGIAIRRELFIALGGHPVIYGDACKASEASIPAWCRHGGGPFTREAEWRLYGDLSLGELPASAWRSLVPVGESGGAFDRGRHVWTWTEWLEKLRNPDSND